MPSGKAASDAPARRRSQRCRASPVGPWPRPTSSISGSTSPKGIEQADRGVDKPNEKFKLFAKQPLTGRARDELAAGQRSFPFGRYVIFYEPIEGGLDVVRVLHSARDIDAVFDEDQ
jgi:toxin ParE1/3/4